MEGRLAPALMLFRTLAVEVEEIDVLDAALNSVEEMLEELLELLESW